jgi:hypothetical protein
VLIVGETVLRKRIKSHPAERTLAMLMQECPTLRLEHVIQDEIPDVRRSRRTGAATKRELILVLKKGGSIAGRGTFNGRRARKSAVK